MKKATSKKRRPVMLDEYDFSKGVRGKYAKRYSEAANAVVLDPDVAALFPTAKAVNDALRAQAKIAGRHGKSTAAKGR